ncbi:PAX3- and PAX7-binding protein 1-like isoform X1 [Myxocyprinus asiaticus]|uniref:PAX3- and PAX7-binding protein 1-like isoform X1 n=1 Tax=Myxocyprinus asiaticus TaxID=70543 RepID=UPI0022231653|nr:PAX3- and PAX7-binding protein 1-like isoform X1 [Myxocyprinus asiaticus]
MFKKAKRCNLRRRNDSDDEEKKEDQQTSGPGAENSVNSSEITTTSLATGANMLNNLGNGFQPGAVKFSKEKKKKKENREEPKASLLSFHDDEDDTEVFRVKKSNYSKKIVKQLKKEYMEDLEKSSDTIQGQSTRFDGGPGQKLVIKEEPLEGSRASSEQGEEEMEVDSNEEQDEESEQRSGGAEFSQTLSALSSLRPGEIPDAAFIHAARKRRQMARELGGEGNLVENEVTNKRLVREDEQGGSDDDEDEKRIVFSGVKMKSQRQKIAEEIGIEGSDDEALDNGQDEEVSRWEQEQIRKGISIPQVQTTQSEETAMYYQGSYDAQPYGASYAMQFTYPTVGADNSKPLKTETSVPYPILSSDLPPITTDLVKKRLKDRYGLNCLLIGGYCNPSNSQFRSVQFVGISLDIFLNVLKLYRFDCFGMPASSDAQHVNLHYSHLLKMNCTLDYQNSVMRGCTNHRGSQLRLSFMRQGHSSNTRRYEQIQEELVASNKTIQLLEGSSQEAEDKYRFLQEMRGYVGDLLECFSEKVPVILELEAAMHQLLRQRASRLVQRRQDDIKDESSEFSSLSSKAVMAPNLDSFGRDRTAYHELAKQRRIAEREARRTRRRQAREQNGKRAEHKEGLSSDDEETSTDITSYNLERDRILKELKKVFEDVVEDFHSLDNIKSHFETWRKLYLTCYRDAYINLCLPKLFNPLIRLQLITWSPLEVECPNFEYMLWFESLLFYGCEDQSTLKKEEDIDNSLLPAIVERVILPKLAVLTDQVWDPLSNSQTSRLVAYMQRLIKDYPTVLHGENRNTQELLKTIVMRIRRTLDDDIFLPLFPKNVMENKNSGPYLFSQRQFWSCVKFLGNILKWDGILSQSVLKELAIDSTLNRYILSAMQSVDVSEESVEKCRRVVECFPVQWFSSLKGQQTLPQMENFCRYMKHIASSVYRSCVAGSDVEKRNAREHIKEMVRLLGRLNALDHVITVASEHGIKDIKTLLENK